MRALTVGLGPAFLHAPPSTGAGRVHHSVVGELFPRLARRPRPWRRPDVWLTDASMDEFPAEQPIAAVCHGAEWLLDPAIFDATPREFWEPLLPRVERGVRAAAVTIVPSEYTRRAITTGWGIDPERVFAVHHGVDTRRFAARPGGRRLVADRLGSSRPYVLFVGVASAAKGILQLKAAMASLARNGYPHALAVAGPLASLEPAEWREEVAREIDGAPGRLCWFENAGDDLLVPLYSEADVMCLPSIKESFGLPVLEAMSCGAPVAVADRAALPEVVGEAGVVCEPDPDAIAGALRTVLDDPDLAAELRRRGRARAESRTWAHTAQGWLAALRHAVDADT